MFQVEKLEMVFQSTAYRKRGYNNLQEFFPYVEKRLENPVLRKIFEELLTVAGIKLEPEM